jgi:hypothetical protein
MTGANYVQEANEVALAVPISPSKAFRRFMISNLISLPFIVIFVVTSPFLVDFLSSSKLTADWNLTAAYVLVSLIQQGWVVVSNLVYKSEADTKKLGLSILRLVIPISVISTILGGIFSGAAGVVLATSISYCIAIFLAAMIVWKR